MRGMSIFTGLVNKNGDILVWLVVYIHRSPGSCRDVENVGEARIGEVPAEVPALVTALLDPAARIRTLAE
mgnify:FL=1